MARMDLRSQTLCHSVSRVLTHSLRASWVASIMCLWYCAITCLFHICKRDLTQQQPPQPQQPATVIVKKRPCDSSPALRQNSPPVKKKIALS